MKDLFGDLLPPFIGKFHITVGVATTAARGD